MAMKKVLIAEDTPDLFELLSDKVSAAGFTVIPAKDGDEAWERICSDDPDVILLDLMMPKMSGFEVLEKLRRNPPADKWQPVVIVSALSDLDTMKRTFAMEAEHYITKPFQPDDVIRAIRKMLKLIPMRKPPEKGN